LKTTQRYWNPLDIKNAGQWEEIEGSDGNIQQITIAEDLRILGKNFSTLKNAISL